MIQTITVTPTGAQIASGGEWTVVNNDLFTALTIATTSDFNVITTVSIPPLTAGSFDGPLYAKAASDISVSVIPKAQGYIPGSVVAVNTSDVHIASFDDPLATSYTLTIPLFTATRTSTLQYISGDVYITYSSSSVGTVPISFTYETSAGLVIASGTNYQAADEYSYYDNQVSITNLSTYTLIAGQSINLLLSNSFHYIGANSSNLAIGYQ